MQRSDYWVDVCRSQEYDLRMFATSCAGMGNMDLSVALNPSSSLRYMQYIC